MEPVQPESSSPRRLRLPQGLLIITLALWNVITLWTSPNRTAWLTDLTILATCFVIAEGLDAERRVGARGRGRTAGGARRAGRGRADAHLAGLGRYGTRTRRDRELTAFAAYGRAVRAPCDGLVVSATDGFEDQDTRPGGRARYQPPYGNHVFIDTGREIVKLAHLRAGSLTVSQGDAVRVGQLLGETGNSGNTTEPHLHLHAERDGVGLDLRFTDISGRLYRGG